MPIYTPKAVWPTPTTELAGPWLQTLLSRILRPYGIVGRTPRYPALRQSIASDAPVDESGT